MLHRRIARAQEQAHLATVGEQIEGAAQDWEEEIVSSEEEGLVFFDGGHALHVSMWRAALCCAVACCVVPCRAVLCCAVLCCAVPHHVAAYAFLSACAAEPKKSKTIMENILTPSPNCYVLCPISQDIWAKNLVTLLLHS